MEQMQNFIKGLKSQTCMFLDTSVGVIIRSMTEPWVKDLIDKTCINEYCSKSERSIKLKHWEHLKVVSCWYLYCFFKIELLNKTLAQISLSKANMS